MMNELYKNGPITCAMSVTSEFMNYKDGVFEDKTGATDLNHDISIVGWGEEEDGTKYWLGRNSWGTYWGLQGLFKIVRGKNNTGIEGHCSYAIPLDTWTTDERNKTIPDSTSDA